LRTRYEVPRTPITAVGVLTSSGRARRTLLASTSMLPLSRRRLAATRPSSMAAAVALIRNRRCSSSRPSVAGASLTREPSASSTTAVLASPVRIESPTLNVAPAAAGRPAMRTSPNALTSRAGTSLDCR